MKKLAILGIIVCVVMLFGPALAISGPPTGPPGGLDVNIVNPLPVPVNGEMIVTNDSSAPVIVRDEGKEACRREAASFHKWYNLSALNNEIDFDLEIEEGEVFVIESISVFLEAEPDTLIRNIHLAKTNPYKPLLFIPAPKQGEKVTAGIKSTCYTGFVAPGIVVGGEIDVVAFLNMHVEDINDLIRTEVTINGYYVSEDCPQP